MIVLYHYYQFFFLFKKRKPLSFNTGSLAQHFPVQAVSTQKKDGTDRAGGRYREEADQKTEICHQSLTLCLLAHEGISTASREKQHVVQQKN